MENIEKWKRVWGYANYEVSTLGKVRNKDKEVKPLIIMNKTKFIEQVKTVCEYAILEGRNTDWSNVVESLVKLEDKVEGLELSESELNNFTACVGRLVDMERVIKKYGVDDKTNVYNLLVVNELYRTIQNW